MASTVHIWNWYSGWALILSAFLTGAWIGLSFHDDSFLGGYGSFRRRLVRLGHIAQAALGMLNVLYGLSPWPVHTDWHALAASLCFLMGGVSMPLVCFLTAWKEVWRSLFFIPVVSLLLAVIFTLQGGPT
jgi:hypothetical protein